MEIGSRLALLNGGSGKGRAGDEGWYDPPIDENDQIGDENRGRKGGGRTINLA